MKRVLLLAGVAVFWLAWPVWFAYFKLSSRRSRILVVHGNQVLLLKGWLGTGEWSLPGGGAHSREAMIASAVRELKEETGIITAKSNLRPLGVRDRTRHGLGYRAWYFVLELPRRPDIKRRRIEIAEIAWFTFDAVRSLSLSEDAAYALEEYERSQNTNLGTEA